MKQITIVLFFDSFFYFSHLVKTHIEHSRLCDLYSFIWKALYKTKQLTWSLKTNGSHRMCLSELVRIDISVDSETYLLSENDI